MTDTSSRLKEAIAAYAAELNINREQATEHILRDWLTKHGYLAVEGEEGTRPEDLNASNDD